jgi:predicted transcriptional regulator
MRNPMDIRRGDVKRTNIEKIRVLLCGSGLTTGQIEYLTGINTNTLRHYLGKMKNNGHISHEKQPVNGCFSINLYRITEEGRIVRPPEPKTVADAGCNRDYLVAALFGTSNVSA